MTDERVPVRFGRPRPDEAVLVEGEDFRLAAHPIGCACCAPRGAVAEALSRLFIARARGEVAWFRSVAVLATPAGEAAVRAALAQDQVSAGRFRLAER